MKTQTVKSCFHYGGREEEHVRDEVGSTIWAVLLASLCREIGPLAAILRQPIEH